MWAGALPPSGDTIYWCAIVSRIVDEHARRVLREAAGRGEERSGGEGAKLEAGRTVHSVVPITTTASLSLPRSSHHHPHRGECGRQGTGWPSTRRSLQTGQTILERQGARNMHVFNGWRVPQQTLVLSLVESASVRPPVSLRFRRPHGASSHVNTTPNAAKTMSCSLNCAGMRTIIRRPDLQTCGLNI